MATLAVVLFGVACDGPDPAADRAKPAGQPANAGGEAGEPKPSNTPPLSPPAAAVATAGDLGFDVTSYTVAAQTTGSFPLTATAVVNVGKLRDAKQVLSLRSVCEVGGETYVGTAVEAIVRSKAPGGVVTATEKLFEYGWKEAKGVGDCDHWLTFKHRLRGPLDQPRETLLAVACTRAGETTQEGCPELPELEPPSPMSAASVSATIVSAESKLDMLHERYELPVVMDVKVNAPVGIHWDLEMRVECRAGTERSSFADGLMGPSLGDLRTGQSARLTLWGAMEKEETLSRPAETCDIALLARRDYGEATLPLTTWCYEAGKPVRAGRCT